MNYHKWIFPIDTGRGSFQAHVRLRTLRLRHLGNVLIREQDVLNTVHCEFDEHFQIGDVAILPATNIVSLVIAEPRCSLCDLAYLEICDVVLYASGQSLLCYLILFSRILRDCEILYEEFEGLPQPYSS